jgi:hypothetical protein
MGNLASGMKHADSTLRFCVWNRGSSDCRICVEKIKERNSATSTRNRQKTESLNHA